MSGDEVVICVLSIACICVFLQDKGMVPRPSILTLLTVDVLLRVKNSRYFARKLSALLLFQLPV